jgi:hypothetical protein
MAICSYYRLVFIKLIPPELMLGNNYGLGDTRKTELLEACQTLGITRKDRCVVLDHKYCVPPEHAAENVLGRFKIIRKYGGTRIPLPRLWQNM